MYRKQFILPLIKTICKEEQIEFIEEPTRGMYLVLIFENGKHFFLKDVNFNINRIGSMRITKNKALTSFFLEQFGYKTPVYTMVYTEDKCKRFKTDENVSAGMKFAHHIGYPVIAKVNDSSQGRGIYKMFNDDEFVAVAAKIFQSTHMFQIQKYYNYNDYRVVVLGESVISAYQRVPLNIIGDGVHTVEELLIEKQNKYIDAGRDTVINIYGHETVSCLDRNHLSLNSIVESGRKVVLRDVSNLSAGGECIELTEQIHDDFSKLCISISKDLNLDLCGVDIMCPSITESMTDYVVLEVNSAPGLDNYAFNADHQQEYVKELYRKVILFLKAKMLAKQD